MTGKKRELEERAALYRQGFIDSEIAKRTGRTSRAIGLWRERNGLPPNVHDGPILRLPCHKEAQRRELYDRGLSDGRIGALLGGSAGAISKWRLKRGLPSNMERARGFCRPKQRAASGGLKDEREH